MTETPKKKSTFKSCLLPGCLGLVIMCVIIAGVSFFATKSFVNKSIESYTTETPTGLASTPLPESEYKALESKLFAFEKALNSDADPFELSLTDTEINGLIAESKSLKALKDKMEVSLSGDTLLADVSWPTDQFANIPMLGALGARYFNGKLELDVSLENGNLEIFLLGAETNGKTLPAALIEGLSNENLAEHFMDDPDVKEFVDKLESFKVENGQAIFKTR